MEWEARPEGKRTRGRPQTKWTLNQDQEKWRSLLSSTAKGRRETTKARNEGGIALMGVDDDSAEKVNKQGGGMNNPLREAYCCCQLFYLRQGIFLCLAHSFLQATFGILVVITSHYRNKDSILNIVVLAANICFFPTGILVFGTTLYNSYKAARFSAFLFTIVTLFNFGTAICYILWYNEFRANSELDKVFFWRNDHDWVAVGQLPFTLWHVLAFSNAVVLILWWYYSYQLWKFANLLKINNYLKEREY